MEKELTSAITWNILEDLSDGVVIIDEADVVIYCNAAAASMLGQKTKHQVNLLDGVRQVLASFDAWSDLITPPTETRLTLADGRVLQAHSQSITTFDGEFIQLILQPLKETTTDTIPFDHVSALINVSKEADPQEQLQRLADELKATGWRHVVISLRDETFNPIRLITTGFTKKEAKQLEKNLIPADAWLALFNEEEWQVYRQGGCYFVPRESEWTKKYLNGNSTKSSAENKDEWQPLDLICVPLYDRRKRPIGLISLDEPADGRRPATKALQLIELYAQYAASIIENARLVQESIDRSQEFELLLTASNALSSSLEIDTVLSLMGTRGKVTLSTDGTPVKNSWRF